MNANGKRGVWSPVGMEYFLSADYADYADYFWIVLKLAPVRYTSRKHAAQPQYLKLLLLFNLRNLRNLRKITNHGLM
jgi:hypothetical protein